MLLKKKEKEKDIVYFYELQKIYLQSVEESFELAFARAVVNVTLDHVCQFHALVTLVIQKRTESSVIGPVISPRCRGSLHESFSEKSG